MTRQRLACAFIFMLAMRDVSAARESFHAAKAAQIVGNNLKESSDRHQQQEKVADAGSFSISTMWARGKHNSLDWLSANVTFRFKEHESPPYVEIDGLDTKYRILPDAVVGMQRIDGMPTILITGWQAWRDNKGRFGSSHYSKDEALWIRTETNPVVGVTTENIFSELLPFGRDEGHKVYEHKEGSKIIRYFINSRGTQKIAEEDAWLVPGQTQSTWGFGPTGFKVELPSFPSGLPANQGRGAVSVDEVSRHDGAALARRRPEANGEARSRSHDVGRRHAGGDVL